MRTLKRYILTEWFSLFSLVIVVISFVLVMGNIIKLVELVVAKGVSIIDVVKLFISLLPSLLIFSIPISILTATLLSFGRLASDNEITAIRCAGGSLYPIIMSFILVGLLFSLLCLYFNDSLIPQSHYNMRNILRSIGIKKPTTYLEEKTFIKVFKDYIIFVYKIKNDKLYDIRIYQPQEDKPTRTIIAKQAELITLAEKNAIKLKLINGMADELNFDNPDNIFLKINFGVYHLTIYLKDIGEINSLDKKTSDMTISEIKNEINTMRKLNIDPTPLLVGLYRKFSLAFSNLALIFIGIPLAVRVKRRERSLGFGLSVIVCLIYYLIMALGESLALRNKIDPIAGVWLANIVLSAVGIFLTYKTIKH